MNIRKATANDLLSIVRVSDEMLDVYCSFDLQYGIYRHYEDSSDFYREKLAKEDRLYLVAEDVDGAIVGFASALLVSMPETDAPPVIGKLVTNFVLEKYRGKGIGTIFHQKRMDWFKEHDVRYVEMTVDTHNVNALRLWKKMGFVEYQIVLKKDL